MDEWIKGFIEFSAAGGTLWAALSAKKSATISAKQLDTQLQQQKNAESPRLIPLNAEIDIPFNGVYTDWFSSKNPASNYLSNKSFFDVKLINTGKTFALDILVTFKFEGGTEIFDYHSESGYLSLTLDDQSKSNSVDVDDFYIHVFEYVSLNQYVDKEDLVHISTTKQYYSLIQHAEVLNIEIPKYFIILSNAYAALQGSNQFKKPRLIMDISYEDEYLNQYKESFTVELNKIDIYNNPGVYINGILTFKKLAYS